MKSINFKTETTGTVEQVVGKVTQALQAEGFGVLTRIDLHAKIKEKLGKDIAPAVILGACNPTLAYEAYSANPDVASLLPCNAVIRELAPGRVSVELAKPTALMEMIEDRSLQALAQGADQKLERVLSGLRQGA
ncbi:MAG: DUF302 domain-containing protein [Bdellovibrionota bacterium]